MVAWGVGRGEGAEGARRRREGCRGLASDPHISGVYPVQAVIKSAAQIYLVAVIRTSGLHSYHHTPTPDKIKNAYPELEQKSLNLSRFFLHLILIHFIYQHVTTQPT